VSTRAILAELTRQLGKPFVVDYRPGAEGLRATEMIARAAPDGYTLGNGNPRTLVGHRIFVPKLPYDPDRDIQPVAQFSAGFSILAVALSLPVNSVQELIDYARKNPASCCTHPLETDS
jgi:tripartite-type tricarboxylate transporter receptor subunit TctC